MSKTAKKPDQSAESGQTDIEITPIEPTNRRVKAILEHIDGGSVLDIGCVQHDAEMEADPNWLHQHLYSHADEVLGIDILEDELAELVDAGYQVTYGDAENFALAQRFDTIVAGELIEHLSDPGAFLDCCRTHLEDDGKLILTTPNVWGIAYLKRLVFPGEVHCNEEHTCWYDRRTLRQLLERHGFDVVEIEFIRPTSETTPTPAPRLFWSLFDSQRLGANELIAIATPAEE